MLAIETLQKSQLHLNDHYKKNIIPMFPNFQCQCQPHSFPNTVSFLTLTHNIKIAEVVDNVIASNRNESYPIITL